MKLTKNALLAQWSAKHEYITNEMSQCKHKLELLDTVSYTHLTLPTNSRV